MKEQIERFAHYGAGVPDLKKLIRLSRAVRQFPTYTGVMLGQAYTFQRAGEALPPFTTGIMPD